MTALVCAAFRRLCSTHSVSRTLAAVSCAQSSLASREGAPWSAGLHLLSPCADQRSQLPVAACQALPMQQVPPPAAATRSARSGRRGREGAMPAEEQPEQLAPGARKRPRQRGVAEHRPAVDGAGRRASQPFASLGLAGAAWALVRALARGVGLACAWACMLSAESAWWCCGGAST